MKINISISLFFNQEDHTQLLYGKVSGSIELGIVPVTGDYISFMWSKNSVQFISIKGFSGSIGVGSRVIIANSNEEKIQLIMEPLVLESRGDAVQVGKYLSDAFDLFEDAP